MVELVLGLFLFILTGSFILERWLDLKNMRYTVTELPDELKDVYDDVAYRKSQLYKRENTRFSFYSGTFSLVVMVAAILLGFFGLLDRYLAEQTNSYYLLVLLFFGILMLISDILTIPFDLWDTFKIEEKFGFNKTTPKTFVFDKLKGWLL
ncbi:MAG: M48 family peptidase, partial [Bacteroidales bacterium]|nr:M48 family peptidase [Bacteroidales bacterium]